MRKKLAFLLAAIMIFVLTACGGAATGEKEYHYDFRADGAASGSGEASAGQEKPEPEPEPEPEDDRVETLKSWSFQYNQGTDDYSVFFALLDKDGKYMAADLEAVIRIVDENGNELYGAKRAVTKRDFDYYTSKAAGEQYLANVRIKAAEVAEGTSANGKVYLMIGKGDEPWFSEVNCEALYCLPVKGATVNAEPLPVEIKVKTFDGYTQSVIQIDSVAYDFDSSISPTLTITLTGAKTYANDKLTYKLPMDTISYKLYDSEGYLVHSDDVYLPSLALGDKFKDDSIVIYDVKPGEDYTLKFTEYSLRG